MGWKEDILTSVRSIVKPMLKPLMRQTLLCTVSGSLDTANYTIKVKPVVDDGPEFSARLNGSERSDYGLVIVPAQGSTVFVTRPPMAIGAAYISKVDVIDKVLIKVGNATAEWDSANGILTLNGGNNKGIPMAPNLVTQYNKLENDINQLKTILSAWVPVPSDGGAALKTALAAYFTQLSLTTLNDIQNPKIQQ